MSAQSLARLSASTLLIVLAGCGGTTSPTASPSTVAGDRSRVVFCYDLNKLLVIRPQLVAPIGNGTLGIDSSFDKLNQLHAQLEADALKLPSDDRRLPTILAVQVRFVVLDLGDVRVSRRFGTPEDVANANRDLRESTSGLMKILADLEGFCD